MTSTLGHLKHKTNIIWVSIINIDLSVDYLLILQVFIFSHFDWICCNRTQGVCVCVSVCLSVCVCHLYSLNGWTDFDETFHKWSDRYLPVSFFAVFEISNLMTSWRPFCIFALRHSHGRNFGPIFFKFGHKLLCCMPVLAIENQQDRLITFGERENCFKKK